MNAQQNAFFSRLARKTPRAFLPSASASLSTKHMQHIVTINVNIPALDNYLNYLNSNAQAKIDSLAKQVNALVAQLNKSEKNLQADVSKQT